MSNRPDNPFQQNAPGTMYGDQQPKTGGSKVWLWVLGSILAVFLLGALVCCGGGYFAYQAGTGMMAEAYTSQLNNNPVIQEHIGDIESMNFDLTATTEQAEASGGAMAFKISGTKGSGILLIHQAPGGDGERIERAELVLPDGTRHEVPVATETPIPDETVELETDPTLTPDANVTDETNVGDEISNEIDLDEPAE